MARCCTICMVHGVLRMDTEMHRITARGKWRRKKYTEGGMEICEENIPVVSKEEEVEFWREKVGLLMKGKDREVQEFVRDVAKTKYWYERDEADLYFRGTLMWKHNKNEVLIKRNAKKKRFSVRPKAMVEFRVEPMPDQWGNANVVEEQIGLGKDTRVEEVVVRKTPKPCPQHKKKQKKVNQEQSKKQENDGKTTSSQMFSQILRNRGYGVNIMKCPGEFPRRDKV